MPLVNAKCTNCGSNLQVDNTKDAAICEFCGSAFIVEKAINNYNIVNNIQANVVNIFGGNSADFVIRAGVLEKYNGSSTEVVIPNSVHRIGPEAFKDCEELTKVTLPDTLKRIGGFENCKNLEEIHIPDGVTHIERKSFCGCEKLATVNIPDSVIQIGDGAFADCKITNVKIPSGVTVIDSYTFSGCKNLTSLTIPDNVTIIHHNAFSSCTALQHVTLSKNLTYLGYGAFSDCTSLISITIPAGVQFGNYLNRRDIYDTFINCTSLTTITIMEDAQTYLPEQAFIGTPWLQEKQQQEKQQQEQQLEQQMLQKQAWQKTNLCDYCGGKFKGLFAKKCTKCGREKQY